MRKPCYVLCLAFAAASVAASTARADSVVTLTVTEITVINAPVQSINTGVPLTFESNDEDFEHRERLGRDRHGEFSVSRGFWRRGRRGAG